VTARNHPPASDAARIEWSRRVEAEYRSAALTHHFAHWLLQVGASPDLFSIAQRIVQDELVHSELSVHVFHAAGGTQIAPIPAEALAIARVAHRPLAHELLLRGVEMFCLGETVAVRLFHRMREGCTVVPAKEALDRILKDEVVHREFGWTFLEWMLDQTPGPQLQEVLSGQLPRLIQQVRNSYQAAESASALSSEDRTWGLISLAEYRDVVEETMERDYRPRFKKWGLDPLRAQ